MLKAYYSESDHSRLRKTIFLISCVGPKRQNPAPSKDLYISPWFRKARSYVEGTGQPWFVLSAKHGLLRPLEVISSYDLTLNSMAIGDRRRWSRNVLSQLQPHLSSVGTVIFLAGLRYREFLVPAVLDYGLDVSVPLEGLRIGEQLRWLNRAIRG